MRQGIKEKDIKNMQKCFDNMSKIIDSIREYNKDAYIIIKDADTIGLVGNEEFAEKQEYIAMQMIIGMTTEQ